VTNLRSVVMPAAVLLTLAVVAWRDDDGRATRAENADLRARLAAAEVRADRAEQRVRELVGRKN
jgi:DUF971 family protein